MVVGVKNEKLQERLLDERTLTLEKATEIAMSMESARKNAENTDKPNRDTHSQVTKVT